MSAIAPIPDPPIPSTDHDVPLAPQAPPAPLAIASAPVTVNVGMPLLIAPQRQGYPLIVRALWYVLVGWWLVALTIVAGYALIVFTFGLALPIAFALFNRVPQLLTLRVRSVRYAVEMRDGVAALVERNPDQIRWWWRALYFPVGIVVGAVWVVVAWVLSVLPLTWPITMPLGIWMLDRTDTVITLQRH